MSRIGKDFVASVVLVSISVLMFSMSTIASTDQVSSAAGQKDQNNSISLENATGVIDGDRILPGSTVEFQLRLQLDPDNDGGLWVYCNAFRLYSLDGAIWDAFHGEYLPVWPNFGDRYISWAGADGIGADTVTFYGEDSAGGFLEVYDDVAWMIVVEIPNNPALYSKTICLDSVVLPHQWLFNKSWVWATLSTEYTPTWDGPHCFTIIDQCCVGITGNVDGDPGEIIDIGDLTALIDYLFLTYTPPDCMEEANCDGSLDGIIDIGDLTALIDYLFLTMTPPAECP